MNAKEYLIMSALSQPGASECCPYPFVQMYAKMPIFAVPSQFKGYLQISLNILSHEIL